MATLPWRFTIWSDQARAGRRTPRFRSRRRSGARPGVEALENRELLTGYPYQMWNFPSTFGQVTAMVAGTDGAVWVATDVLKDPNQTPPAVIGPAEVSRIAPDGTMQSFPLTNTAHVDALAAGTDGKMWFIQHDTGSGVAQLDYITSGGGIVAISVPVQIGPPTALAVTPDNKVWFNSFQNASYALERYDPAANHFDTFASTLEPITLLYPAPGNLGLYAVGHGPPNGVFFDIYAGLIDSTTGQLIASANSYPFTPTELGPGPISPFALTPGPPNTVWCVDIVNSHGYVLQFDPAPYGALGLLHVNEATATQNTIPGITPRSPLGPLIAVAGGDDGYLYLAADYCVLAADPQNAYYDTSNNPQVNADASFLMDQHQGAVAVAAGQDGNVWFGAAGSWWTPGPGLPRSGRRRPMAGSRSSRRTSASVRTSRSRSTLATRCTSRSTPRPVPTTPTSSRSPIPFPRG